MSWLTLSHEQKLFVRKLRVDEGLSWRGVAEKFHQKFPGSPVIPGNQLVGMELCKIAAKYFFENMFDGKWN